MRIARGSRRSAQSGTEYTLLISVVVLAVVYFGYSFVSPFTNGVNELGRDVKDILSGQTIGGVGRNPTGSGSGPGSGSGTGTGGTRSVADSIPTGLSSPNDPKKINKALTKKFGLGSMDNVPVDTRGEPGDNDA